MSDDDIDSIPDMPVRQVWRTVGTWEGSPLPKGRKPIRRGEISDDQQRVLNTVARVQPASREQIADAMDPPMKLAAVGHKLQRLSVRGLCKAVGLGPHAKWVIA